MNLNDYREFLQKKTIASAGTGFDCLPQEVNPFLKPHQRDIVSWAVRGGKRGIFTAFGLGKTLIQIETERLILSKCGGGWGLIVCPLGVRQEFKRDAEKIGLDVKFIRSKSEALMDGIYLTNYESVRDGKLDVRDFKVVSLDEASILRGMGGTKTFREFMRLFEGTSTFRFVATATPSPNEYIELLSYAAFLGIMEVSEAKTRFFKRDSTKADKLTLHPHKEEEFWLWVSSWAMFLQKPSDLGYSDEGYTLPEMKINWHEIPTDHKLAGWEKAEKGLARQGKLLKDTSIGLSEAAQEKRESLQDRVKKMLELRQEDMGAHRLIWHDLESERLALEKAVPSAVSIYGSQDLEEREQAVMDFSDGKIQELLAKPVIAGSGCNFQRFCSWAIFLGIGFKFNDFIQAIHRIQRFLQTKTVRIDLIFTEAEREVKRQLVRKWDNHKKLVENMTAIIKKYGLSHEALAGAMKRSLGTERIEESGENWRLIKNDTVEETAAMPDNSVGIILTSIPFSSQYEYTPSYNDFGHTDDNAHFFRQMDFLTPNLLRVLQPGRIAAIHIKDRISPGGLTGMGFQTVQPFHCETIAHFIKHGFAYLGMKTIVTDVVRENNQTYRLGWTEQCKDGSRMGVGMPEYLLLFRKPPTDSSKGYADVPVVKSKEKYSRSRWQIDAHGFARSSGNRLLTIEDLDGLAHEKIFKLFREFSSKNVYDFEHHVALCESLEKSGRLPVTFMLLQPTSWHDDVWTDVARMRTLNANQYQNNREFHLCPMQFDVADRVIAQMSNSGDVVFDPFAGLGTVPLQAIKAGRRGLGVELNPGYFIDSVFYCRAADREKASPTLFDLDKALA